MLYATKDFFRRLSSGYYNLLLLTTILLFVFRPYGEGFFYLAVWKLLSIVVFWSVILNSKPNRSMRIAMITLIIPMTILNWFDPSDLKGIPFVINFVLTIGFLLLSTCSIIYDVAMRTSVSAETLRGIVCAFFIAAFAFAYFFFLVEYFNPNSLYFSNRKELTIANYTDFLSEMFYFSFVTILAIGYGDVTPAKDLAQTGIVIEGIFGQFYVAILVARLVSIYALRTSIPSKTQENLPK